MPQTSTARLMRATQEFAQATEKTRAEAGDTVLYLAYGSNMCAETFLGKRGVRPLSQVNVSAPTLKLSFNLSGIPYEEPCFANVVIRKKLPKLPDGPKFPSPPPFDPPAYAHGVWDGSLMGVVYEVTREDYAAIIRTEGGGTGYKEIVVPCVPLPPDVSVGDPSPIPELPRPVLARTLYMPYRLTEGGGGDDDDDDDDDGKPTRERPLLARIFGGRQRREPDYAQPSPRYLKLLRDGADEHNLPAAYQRYLGDLQAYRRTTAMQEIGRVVFLASCGPVILTLMALAQATAYRDGTYRPAVATLMNAVFNILWVAYDCIFKPVFGDGERTQE
ncbi:gliotoxin biosynthesis protein GliK [Geosmithia morbida]|uniref:gamma-glutamylcyclotransferase n=1 Tax=Geosmithia morbida TaxID=1094350 RepID=A0A9P4Z3D9_9HYPO|nr:gliotoxin biosynthesis protein GliK [Geosmithia morbida]KAF4126970.1 gliotoxin biosynthesis protein GliK [Geosmithia morbida]